MADVRILNLPFKRFFDSVPAGLVLADPRGNIFIVNPAFLRLIDGRPEEIIGRNILSLVSPEKTHRMCDVLEGLSTDSSRDTREKLFSATVKDTPCRRCLARRWCGSRKERRHA